MGGGWGGHMGEVVPSRVFSIFFGSFNASTAYPEKRGFSLNVPKMCFDGGCAPFGSVFPGGQIFSFLPPKPFFHGPNYFFIIILHESEQETSLVVNDSSVKS